MSALGNKTVPVTGGSINRSNGDVQLVCITVCTARRPIMLADCLASLAAQEVPPGWKAMIVVCENDIEATCRKQVLDFAATCPLETHYLHEPERGIPIARNRTLEKSLELGADWIAYVDDDEMAKSDWLTRFCEATVCYQADILKGPVIAVFPKTTPDWFPKVNKTVRPTGSRENSIYTSNTMMRAGIASPSGLALRFNEGLRFTGGSDTDYFKRAIDRGMRAIAVADAVVSETIPPERLTSSWQAQRKIRTNANYMKRRIENKGYISSIVLFIFALLSTIIKLSYKTLGIILLIFVNMKKTKSLALEILLDASKPVGYFLALINRMPQPYKVTDGY